MILPLDETIANACGFAGMAAVVGAYAYGVEPLAGGRRTFDLAFELVAAHDLGRLVGATYPLSRYTDALSHAANAGRRGTVKVAFDMRDEKARNR